MARKLVAFLALAFPCFAASERTYVYNHTLVFGGSNLTSFPALFSGTFTYLKTVANGGSVLNSNGYDIYFTSGTPPTRANLLNFERVKYNGTTGTVEFWIQIPSLLSASDTTIYLNYGDPNVTSDLQNRTGTWDSNFQAVYHFGDGTSLNLTDSTSHHNDGTGHGTPTFTNGMIYGQTGAIPGGALALNATSYISIPAPANLDNGPLTVQLFAQNFNTNLGIIGKSSTNGWDVRTCGADVCFSVVNSGVACNNSRAGIGTGNPWVVDFTYNGSGTTTFYYDSLAGNNYSGGQTASCTMGSNSAVPIALGAFSGGSGNFYGMNLDEIWISNTVRSAGWLQTKAYNSGCCGNTTYTIGSVTTVANIVLTGQTQIGAFITGP